MRRRKNTATVYRTIEIEVECEVEIEPGEKAIMWGDNACPGSPPTAEIVSAQTEDGVDVMKLLTEGDIRAIEDRAIEQAGEDEQDARAAAEDDAADAERDRRRGL
jgi:hypothetical protein